MSAGLDSGVPDAEDLLGAVAETLREELLPHLVGRDRYQVQVCIAAVDMVRRELELGSEVAVADAELRRATDTPDDAALIAQIRAGLSQERFAEVAEALRGRVEAELLVVRPDAVGGASPQSSRQ